MLAADRPISPRRLLVAAALLHIIVTLTITAIGKTRVFPNTFDTNGIGIAFAIDSVTYREQALQMAELLQRGELRQWVYHRPASVSPFHLRLISICLAVFGPILGYGILAVEPLNLTYYLLILIFTYRIGEVTFSPSTGQLAATVVGLWPSLLMHTTQMMRDPLFIGSFLLLIFCLLVCLRTELSTKHAIRSAGGALLAFSLILLLKANVWEVVSAALIVWMFICVVVQLRLKQWSWPRLIVIVTVTLGALALPRMIPHFRMPDRAPMSSSAGTNPMRGNTNASNQGLWSGVVSRIGSLRYGFISRYGQSGSSLDTEVQLNSTKDIVTYLPRAAAIGFFAPFPRMWFSPGVEVGLSGRLIAGIETVGLYFALMLVAVTLFYECKRVSVWFLFAVSCLGCVSLGYVVVNVAALYRMRYPYFILLLILAAQGFQIARWLRMPKRSITEPEATATGCGPTNG